MSEVSVSEPSVSSGKRSHVVIMASAGTGKTHQLSNRYLKLLFDGESPERILATTFTRKAAGEIFDRTVERLVAACTDEVARHHLANDLHEPELTRERCLDLLAKLSRNLHLTRIDTLDAFFAEVARCFSLEMQLPSVWRIVEEAEDKRIRAQAIDRLLDAQQLHVAKQLVHWITGTESSRGVASVLHNEVERAYGVYVETRGAGDSAWQLLNPEHPTKSQAELAMDIDRLQRLAIDDGRLRAAVDKAITAALDGDWKEFHGCTMVRHACDSRVYHRKPMPIELIDALAPLAEYAQAQVCFGIARRTAAAYDLLREFDRHYRRCKRDFGAIRFDDVPIELEHLNADGSPQRLAYRLDGWIDHVLLDEFQDTSAMQWTVLKSLSERIAADETGQRTFFCVGDVKQAIYGFRGGTSTILQALATPSSRELPHVRTESLSISHRSDQAIIDFVNTVFKNLAQHPNLNAAQSVRAAAWTAEFPHHETARVELPGYACLQVAPETEGEQRLRTLAYAAEVASQMYFDAQHLGCAVLVNTNKAVAFVIDELLHRGINASAEGGNPLTDSAAVRVMLSALEVAEHPSDTASAFHVTHSLLGPQLGLRSDNFGDRKLLANLGERIRRELLTLGYGDVLAGWADILRPACSKREWYRVQQFLDLAYSYGESLTTRPIDFVRHVELTNKADPTASKMQVMTIHQAKGLGFDRVVVSELYQPDRSPSFSYARDPGTHKASKVIRYVGEKERSVLPDDVARIMQEDDERRAEDALCDLYVALTRAKHELRVVISPGQQKPGKMPKQAEGYLRSALTRSPVAPSEEILAEFGDPQWHRLCPPPAKLDGSEQPRTRPAIRLQPALVTGELQAPSAAQDEDARFRRLTLHKAFDAGRSKAMQFGTLVHAWFEQIEWLDDRPDLSDDCLLTIAAQAEVPLVDPAVALVQFRRYLELPGIQAALHRDSYVKLATARHSLFPLGGVVAEPDLPLFQSETELSFEVQNEVAVASTTGANDAWGIVDRLVLWHVDGQLEAAHILDYKTDVLDGSTAQLRQEYEQQLAAYITAISSAYQLPAEAIAADLIALATGDLV